VESKNEEIELWKSKIHREIYGIPFDRPDSALSTLVFPYKSLRNQKRYPRKQMMIFATKTFALSSNIGK